MGTEQQSLKGILEHATIINQTDIAFNEIASRPEMHRIFSVMENWVNETVHPEARRGTLFHRDKYAIPGNHFEQIALARQAAHDDVVAGVLDNMEALAFSKVTFKGGDSDQEFVANEVAARLDLDSTLRSIWTEALTSARVHAAVWWKSDEIKIEGFRRRKSVRVNYPRAVSILDPLKVVPVGSTMFGQEAHAYIADYDENEKFAEEAARRGSGDVDEVFRRLIVNRYEPSNEERKWMGELGISTERLWLMNEANLFHHSLTKPAYRRFPELPMRSLFTLLDMKTQLQQHDRSTLIGGTNFIIIVTKGTDTHPAEPEEIVDLSVAVQSLAKTPVMIGDHRLKVEIVTPKVDQTLEPKRYNVLDGRITARLYGIFVLGNFAAGSSGDDSIKLSKAIGRGIESRRHMLLRATEKYLWRPMAEKNEFFDVMPKMRYKPRSVTLDFDAGLANLLLDLRESREISRDTILSQFDISQAEEAEMLQREAEEYDEIFRTINPNNQGQPSPGDEDPRRAGRRRGGAAPGTGQGQEPRDPRSPSDGRGRREMAAEEEGDDDDE